MFKLSCTSRRVKFIRLALTVLLCILPCGSSVAQEQRLDPQRSDKLDVVLLLDSSGSMRLTDPQRLRDEGARLLWEFLKEQDHIALMSFSDSTELLRKLDPVVEQDSEGIEAVIAAIANDGMYTDIYKAVVDAVALLDHSARSDAEQVIVLLSDGKMEPSPDSGTPQIRTAALLDDVLPRLKTRNIKLHTLAFSTEADRELLAQAALAADGIHWFAPTADSIHKAFAELFLAVKKPQVVPLTREGFKIDGEVQEATFYINREDEEAAVSLLSPTGKRFEPKNREDGFKWFRGNKFDVVTVRDPDVGTWQIEGITLQEGYATVLTDLKLVTAWPNSISSGEKVLLQARLYEVDKPVALPAMTEVTKYAFQVIPTDKVSPPILREPLYDDGTHGDLVARDGIFSAYIAIEEPGEYRLQTIAKTPTFERHQQQPFRVKPRLVSLSVVSEVDSEASAAPAMGSDSAAASEGGQHLFKIELSDEAARLSKQIVKLTAVDKDRKKYNLPVMPDGRTSFIAQSTLLPREGIYSLTASLSAYDRRNQRVSAQSKKVSYIKSGGESSALVVEEVVVAKPDVEVEQPRESPPFLHYMLVLLTNAAAGVIGFFRIRRGGGSGAAAELPDIIFPQSAVAALELLEKKQAMQEMNLEDPILHDESIEIKVLDALPETEPEQQDVGEGAGSAESGNSDSGSAEDRQPDADESDSEKEDLSEALDEPSELEQPEEESELEK